MHSVEMLNKCTMWPQISKIDLCNQLLPFTLIAIHLMTRRRIGIILIDPDLSDINPDSDPDNSDLNPDNPDPNYDPNPYPDPIS